MPIAPPPVDPISTWGIGTLACVMAVIWVRMLAQSGAVRTGSGAGALALVAAHRAGVRVPRAVIWIWNLWGFACLAVIVGVAVLSSPMVRFFGEDPRHLNTWVLFFPYVWLPVVLVTIAVSGHIVVTRALVGHGWPSEKGPARCRVRG